MAVLINLPVNIAALIRKYFVYVYVVTLILQGCYSSTVGKYTGANVHIYVILWYCNTFGDDLFRLCFLASDRVF